MIITTPKELIGAFVNERQGHEANASWGSYSAIGLRRDGRLVAGVIFNNSESANICMHIGAEDGSRWMTRDYLYACFYYPFEQLGKRRVTACIRSKNEKAVSFAENLGFKYEARLPHWYEEDDMLVYGMLRERCRFLEKKAA